MKKIAFNTANLVARVSGYRFSLNNWGRQHDATVAATNEGVWREICREIADCGFQAVEVWEALASPQVMDEKKARRRRMILEEYGLQPIGYGGGFNLKTIQVCQWLGVEVINGAGMGGTPDEVSVWSVESGVRFNYENHPETSIEQILAKIDGGRPQIGICLDTGWLGTQGVDAPRAIRELGPLVRHIHVKDVRAVDGHETCALGEGVVDIPGCLTAAREIGYSGWYSWEDEPENRNPFDSAVRSREYLERLL